LSFTVFLSNIEKSLLSVQQNSEKIMSEINNENASNLIGLLESNMPNLDLLRRGKVREVYQLDNYYLIVTSDRISAFDVIMNQAVPGKGIILNNITKFWFQKTKEIIPNHFITSNLEEYPEECKEYADQLRGRSMIIKKCKPLPVEFVVRGYITGSGWKEYQNSGTVCGIKLQEGLQEYQQLSEPIFTPATKAEEGHDENISFDEAAKILGQETAEYLRDISIKLYTFGRDYLSERNIILADTKFEFGIDEEGTIILIDEALTPDSSRFWLKEFYAPGKEQINFDKQVLRDWLETITWNKMPPPPEVPKEIIQKTLDKYKEAETRILS
jgi:phosphoribosylaminoimidazole-succinocarboxamide synthase